MARERILYRTIVHGAGRSFSYAPATGLTVPWHCHADYELIYFREGNGQEFIGDSVERYRAGDMVLIGAGVPHLHLCDSVASPALPRTVCDILQFPRGIFPADMEAVQEYAYVRAVLKKSLRGVKFRNRQLVEEAVAVLMEAEKCGGVERLMGLVRMLDMLGRSDDVSFVSPVGCVADIAVGSWNDPVGKVYAYFMDRFREKFELERVARYAGMSPAALCRCFRAGTGMTMSECLNGIRVEHACRLLAYSNLTVAQAAYESGFNNLSHFNRHFRLVTGQTPSQYRKRIRTELP